MALAATVFLERALQQATALRNAGHLPMWTIYDRPTDYPQSFVARLFATDSVEGKNVVIVAAKLGDLRDLFEQHGYVCLDRAESDEPQIVEVWL